jgi:hypothetical protein
MAGFEVIIYGRFWVITEGSSKILRLSPDHGAYGHSCPFTFGHQLTLGVLERWYTL